MFETVSVDNALKRGKRTVIYPSIAIIFSGIILMCFAVGYAKSAQLILIAVSFIIVFLLAWLYWSMAVVKWRLWAVENVRNVHELKQRAVVEQLTWSDKSWFNKTEIWTQAQREKWQELQRKFDVPDSFTDDYNVTSETQIRYSRGQKLFLAILMLLFFGGGLFWVFAQNEYLAGGFVCAFTGVLAGLAIRQYLNRKPQLVLSNEGIETIKAGFYKWSEVSNEQVQRKQEGKHAAYYLVYLHPNGTVKLNISDLDINYTQISKLLILYRGRYESKRRAVAGI